MIVKARFRPEDAKPGEVTSAEARSLALSYVLELSVENGRYKSLAEVALAVGLSRSRLSQVTRARWTSVATQERVLGHARYGGQP